jgi:hypothetical protein
VQYQFSAAVFRTDSVSGRAFDFRRNLYLKRNFVGLSPYSDSCCKSVQNPFPGVVLPSDSLRGRAIDFCTNPDFNGNFIGLSRYSD